MRTWNRNVTDSNKPILDLIIPRYFPIWQSKEMSHDFVRRQSVAETCFSHWGYLQSPCSLWEQEFSRYPSTVNCVSVSCSGMIESSLLLVYHSDRLSQSHCSLWEQEFNRYPSTVNCQPCLCVSLYCSQQLPAAIIELEVIASTTSNSWRKMRKAEINRPFNFFQRILN